jgi:hypothetical protein
MQWLVSTRVSVDVDCFVSSVVDVGAVGDVSVVVVVVVVVIAINLVSVFCACDKLFHIPRQ